jgi:hypothetical protein
MPLRPGARVVDGRDEAGRVDELDHRGTERGRGAMSHTHPEPPAQPEIGALVMPDGAPISRPANADTGLSLII